MDNILIETIESYNDYLSKLPSGSLKIAELLRENSIVESLSNIKNFTEGVIWLVDAGELFKKNNLQVDLNVEQIHSYLNEINDGLTIQDYNLVADLFEYELAPFFSETELVEAPKN